MPKSLKDRLHPEEDFVHIFPVINCPKCRRINVPVAYIPSLRPVPYTLCCYRILKKIRPKGYVSLLDLEECSWDEQL